MSSAFTEMRQPIAATLQRFFWLHPEWWSVALCWFAWLAMLVLGWQHAGHGLTHRITFGQELASWSLMVAAMMLPLVIHAVRQTAEASMWARRHRAIAGFLLGYFAPWLALGIAATGLREVFWAYSSTATAFAFAAAAWWLLTRMHRRGLIACHRRRPLAPLGWQADRDCLRFGGAIGVACVWSCWPLMLACAFAGHGLVAMTGGMVVGTLERWSYRPRTRAAFAGTLALAGYYVVLAGLDQGLIQINGNHMVTLFRTELLAQLSMINRMTLILFLF